MAKKRGYFILYRDIYSSPVFKNLLQASCWIYFISSASHQDKTLKFLGSEVFIKRGEAIMPLRVTAKRFGMTYSEMRSFILRLVRRKMIGTRTTQLQPTNNHPSRKVSIINLINYDKYQYVESEKPPTAHLSQQVLNNNTNTHILNSKSSKDKVVNNGYKTIGNWGEYNILLKDNKKYLKHKWKDEPIKDYQ
jgi:hypothetical protein